MNLASARSSVGRLFMWLFLALAVIFVSGGATCARRETISEFAPPVVFTTTPSLDEITQHINRSLALTQLESNNLTVSGPDLPTKLRGNMKWVRPHNFKFEAYLGTKLMGTALAAGSNRDLFWMQLQSPPTLYFASYEEFESQPGPRRILPVSPLWMREALGVVEMDPQLVHQQPISRADGRIEVRSLIPSPRGAYRRHIVLNPSTGVIEQTILYNNLGRMVAVAQQAEHQYYSAIDYSLPHRVEIQLQPDQGPVISFTVEVGFYLINQSDGSNQAEFQLPDSRGLTRVNLVEANSTSGPLPTNSPAYQPAVRPGTPPVANQSFIPNQHPTGNALPPYQAPASRIPAYDGATDYSARAENPLSNYRGVR